MDIDKRINSFTNIESDRMIKESPLNEIINESSRKELLSFRKNEYLFHEGDPSGGVYFVLSGKVKIVKNENQPTHLILYLVKPGDVLGIHAVINEHCHTNSAVALTSTSVCFIPANEFRQIVNKDNQYKISVMQLLCTNIDLLENKFSGYGDRTTSQRFAGILLLLADTYGMTGKQALKIELAADDLANMAGTTRVYLGKIISDFCNKKWISTKGNAITILDKNSLAAEAKVFLE